ncbi:MAG TPA: RsmG family class I SAM-dependent methyltransferase [Candidatus Eisenbacteria bacterium]|nr:RsmG family class I SAM-dependent methyltransferase [Candidatus Eisenbacteria bacterium]
MARLLEYGELLSDATHRMGIVSRGDRDRLLRKHVRESLAVELVNALPQGARVLDVGAGGGLPGIPLAIVRGDLRVTLLEVRARKAAFLERAKMMLKLTNVDVLPCPMESVRANNAVNTGTTIGWDVAVSRAVAWTRPMVRALRDCVSQDGQLIRFGSSTGEFPGDVRIVLLEGPEPRALQFWPPETWDGLPEAK